MKKLFLSHYSKHAEEVALLAKELRYRGIVPWVDKEGGFAVADESESEARRAISEDCFGLLLYATDDVFERWFVTHVEIDEAKIAKRADRRFLLFALPRKMKFEDLQKRSVATYGIDLSANHTIPAPDGCDLRATLGSFSSEVVRKVLQGMPDKDGDELTVQVSTWEVFPPSVGEVLCIDGREACRLDSGPEEFQRFVQGLRDAKRSLSARFGQPRLRVEGAKHLSAAFAFGRVFSHFRLSIRQRIPSTRSEEYWSNDCHFDRREVLHEEIDIVEGAEILAVQISTGYKNLLPGVDSALAGRGRFSRLSLKAGDALDVDNELCCILADQIYSAIDRTVARTGAAEVHLFAAAPQSLIMMLGQRFAGMPTTFVYDWFDTSYGPSRPVVGGVL